VETREGGGCASSRVLVVALMVRGRQQRAGILCDVVWREVGSGNKEGGVGGSNCLDLGRLSDFGANHNAWQSSCHVRSPDSIRR
jgi:hypothetical protein